MEILACIADSQNAHQIVSELSEYAKDQNFMIGKCAVSSIGKIALNVSFSISGIQYLTFNTFCTIRFCTLRFLDLKQLVQIQITYFSNIFVQQLSSYIYRMYTFRVTAMNISIKLILGEIQEKDIFARYVINALMFFSH